MTSLAIRLEQVAGELAVHVRECGTATLAAAKASEKTAQALISIAARIESIEKTPMRAVRWIGGIVIASTIGVCVQNYVSHEDTNHRSDQVAATAAASEQSTQLLVQRLNQLVAAPPAH